VIYEFVNEPIIELLEGIINNIIDYVESNSNSSIPHLEFSLVIQSNNLTYKGNTYTKYQQFLYDLCKQLHDKGYGYRKIAKMLNKWGLNTYVSYIFSSIKI